MWDGHFDEAQKAAGIDLPPLEGVNEALHALDEGRMIGRGVLIPNEK